jgi:hypothetical protein
MSMAGMLASKLQLKPGQAVRVLSAPDGMDLGVPVAGGSDDRPSDAPAPATIVFVTTFADAEERVAPAVDAALADELAWVAYPKAGKLGTDLNRDSLAALMTARGVRPVRQVAIDDTWSALRFRPPPP